MSNIVIDKSKSVAVSLIELLPNVSIKTLASTGCNPLITVALSTILIPLSKSSLFAINFIEFVFVLLGFNNMIGLIISKYIGEVYGVIKSYSSRVGVGPFVTELNDATGDKIRELGHEYGTTTKRPRRCGWLDIVALNYAIMVNGITGIAMNHLDTVGKLDKIKLCVAYEYNGKREEYFNTNMDFLNNSKPIYEEFEGNFGDISKCRTYEELPENAKKYIDRIEELTDTKIKFIGVGPGREEIIVRNEKVKKLTCQV